MFTMFDVESAAAETMRYVAKRGRFAAGRVNRVCIFDPAALSGLELAACNYDSLMGLNKGLLFTGHVPKRTENTRGEGMVILCDQRLS